MGRVIVNCLNRPEDELIDCGEYGMLKNMTTYNHPAVEGTLVLGYPLTEDAEPESTGTVSATADTDANTGADTEEEV